MKSFVWIEPDDLKAAVTAGAQPGSLFKAGGVDVADRLKEHIDEPRQLVNLRRLRELEFVKLEGGTLRLGPLLTLAAVADDVRIRKAAPALSQAVAAAATPQIRNLATLGGNLAQRPRCWYFRREEFRCRKKGGGTCFAIDGQNEEHAVFGNQICAIVHPSAAATALTALDAAFVLQGPSGSRTVAASEFFVLPDQDVTRENVLRTGEIIVEIRLPANRPSAYVKLMEKQSFDWPLAEAAVNIGSPARVVLGAAAPVPWRAREAEAMIEGRKLDPALIDAAAKAAVRGARPLQHNGHKLALLETAVRRALGSLT